MNCELLLSSQVPLLNRGTLSLRPQSPQFINASVKTNSHPSAKWCGRTKARWHRGFGELSCVRKETGNYNRNFTAHLMLDLTESQITSHFVPHISNLWAWGKDDCDCSVLVKIIGSRHSSYRIGFQKIRFKMMLLGFISIYPCLIAFYYSTVPRTLPPCYFKCGCPVLKW